MNLQRALIFVFLLTAPAFSQHTNVLSTLPMGARAIGMQGAFTAVSNDYSCTYYNPAGIATMHSTTVGLMHSSMSMNRSIDFLSFVYPKSIKHFWGLSVGSYAIRNIEAREGNTITPDYTFGCSYQQFWLSYAYRPISYLSFGANAKWLTGKLNRSRGIGLGFDLGMRLKLTRRISLGVIAQDLETDMNWDTGTMEKYSPIYRGGLIFTPKKNVLLSLSFYNLHDQYKWSLGTEIRMLRILKVRAGLQNAQMGCGTGMSLPITRKMFVLFNYAYTVDPIVINQYFHTFDISLQRF